MILSFSSRPAAPVECRRVPDSDRFCVAAPCSRSGRVSHARIHSYMRDGRPGAKSSAGRPRPADPGQLGGASGLGLGLARCALPLVRPWGPAALCASQHPNTTFPQHHQLAVHHAERREPRCHARFGPQHAVQRPGKGTRAPCLQTTGVRARGVDS